MCLFVSEAVVFHILCWSFGSACGSAPSSLVTAPNAGRGITSTFNQKCYIRAPSKGRGDEDEEFSIPHFY